MLWIKISRKTHYYIALMFLLIYSSIVRVAADSDGSAGIFGEDGAKDLGNLSIFFLIVGSSYVVLRRSYVYSKRYLTDEKYKATREQISSFYKKTKGPMLTFHNITMIIATVLAVIHGIFLGDDFEATGISGWIAAILMVVMSLSGLIIWAKFRPIWDNRASRTQLRFIHRQWLFSGIMIIALIAHTGLFED